MLMEPETGIEPVTFPLPRERSTTEPLRRFMLVLNAPLFPARGNYIKDSPPLQSGDVLVANQQSRRLKEA